MKTRNKQRIQIDDLEIGTCMTVFKNHFRAGPDIFAKLPPKKVQAIGFEIALLDLQKRTEHQQPRQAVSSKRTPKRVYSLKLAVYMYVAFQQVSPGTDVGIDFSRECEAAITMPQQSKTAVWSIELDNLVIAR